MHKVFFEIHKDIPREGPGSKTSTLKALNIIPSLPKSPKVLDVGCGPGQQTLDLAEAIPDADITALDNHQPFLDALKQRAKNAGITERVRGVMGDMFDLQYEDESFDLIWSEGAIDCMGFERGIREWSRLLKPGGYIVTSNIWRAESNVPLEIMELYTAYISEFLTVEESIAKIPEYYELLGHFPLTYSDWWDNYYVPVRKKLSALREKYTGDVEALACIDEQMLENVLFQKYPDSYGYEFYIMRKKAQNKHGGKSIA